MMFVMDMKILSVGLVGTRVLGENPCRQSLVYTFCFKLSLQNYFCQDNFKLPRFQTVTSLIQARLLSEVVANPSISKKDFKFRCRYSR